MKITKELAIDTEYDNYIPFIATITNNLLESKVYYLNRMRDFNEFKNICESNKIVKIFHAATNDIYALSNISIKVIEPYEDTLIAASILNENYETKKLKSLAKIYLNEPCEEAKLLSKLKAKYKREAKKLNKIFKYSDIPKEIIEPYAIKDTEYTMKLWYLFKKPLLKFLYLYNFEKLLIPKIVNMVQAGIKIDRNFCKEMFDNCKANINKKYSDMFIILKSNNINFVKEIIRKRKDLSKEYLIKHNLILKKREIINNDIKFTCYEKYSPDSLKQLQYIIEKLNLALYDVTDKGNLKTDFETLNKYKHIEFIKLLLKYRFYNKQLTTYYEPLLNYYTSNKNNRAHFMFYQSGAKTGRFSAELIQTIPKNLEDKAIEDRRFIRKAFIPEENYYLLCIDYDQIEFRLFAHFANCKTMINGIKNGIDIHLATAFDIFGKEVVLQNDLMKKACRRGIKNLNFGIIYGMGIQALSISLQEMIIDMKKHATKYKIEVNSPYEILQMYYRKLPVKEFISNLTIELYKKGFITLNLNSELIKINRQYHTPQEKAYKGVNMLIQGCAAYIMKNGMLQVDKYIQESKYKNKIKLLLTVHDELVFEIHKSIKKEIIAKKLKEQMEDLITFKVPIQASCKWSDKSWGDVIDLKI